MKEQYVIQAKDVFSKYTDVSIVTAESNEEALLQWRSLNGKTGINVDVRYIEESNKVQRLGLLSDNYWRDIRLLNNSVTMKHNIGVTQQEDCGNIKDKHFLTLDELRRGLSRAEFRDFMGMDLSPEDKAYLNKELDLSNPPF